MKLNKHKENVVGYLIVLFIMLLALAQCYRMKYLTSKILPLFIIGAVIVLIAIGLIIELPAISRLKKESVKADKVKEEKSNAAYGTWGDYCRAGVWVLALFAGVYLIGFIFAVPIFTLAYARWHGTTWSGSVIFAGILTALIYIVFVYGLNVNMTKSFVLNLLTA